MRLETDQRRFLLASRRAVLATLRPDGRPRLVPICLVAIDRDMGTGPTTILYSPVDEKPKRSADPRRLGRVRDVLDRPSASVLVDRWDEDWARLAWLRLDGAARLVEPGAAEHAPAVEALRARYSQYERHALERLPIVAIEVQTATAWGAID